MELNRWLSRGIVVLAISLAGTQVLAAKRTQDESATNYNEKIEQFSDEQSDLVKRTGVITPSLQKDMLDTYTTGFALVNEILKNESLSDEQRAKLLGRVMGEMARTSFQVMRNEYDDQAPDGRVTFLEKVQRMFMEDFYDLRSLIWPLSARGDRSIELVDRFRPLESARREKLTMAIQNLFSADEKENSELLKNAPEQVRLFYYGQMHYLVDRAVNIRIERDSAQYWSRMSYFFAGVFFLLHPIMNFWPTDNYYGWFNSGLVQFGGMAFFYVLKGLTSSLKSTKIWMHLLDHIEEVKDEELTVKIRSMLIDTFPDEYFFPNIPRAVAFNMQMRHNIGTAWSKVRSGVGSTCARLLGKK